MRLVSPLVCTGLPVAQSRRHCAHADQEQPQGGGPINLMLVVTCAEAVHLRFLGAPLRLARPCLRDWHG